MYILLYSIKVSYALTGRASFTKSCLLNHEVVVIPQRSYWWMTRDLAPSYWVKKP
jgi:hypothetical protein